MGNSTSPKRGRPLKKVVQGKKQVKSVTETSDDVKGWLRANEGAGEVKRVVRGGVQGVGMWKAWVAGDERELMGRVLKGAEGLGLFEKAVRKANPGWGDGTVALAVVKQAAMRLWG